MALTFYRPQVRQGFPPWLLLVPIGVALIAWLYQRSRASATATVAPAARLPPPVSPLPVPAASSPLLSAPAAPAAWVTPAKGQQYEPLFLRESARWFLPPGLLSRQALRESAYNPSARSAAGAVGLMQIIPRWHPSIDPGDAAADERAALNPAQAIPYAAKYLRYLFDRFGNWTLALAAYNAGETIVARYGLQDPNNSKSPRIARGGVPPFAETRKYVAAILPDVGIAQPESGVRYV